MALSEEPERLLSVPRVATLFDVKPDTIRDWLKSGKMRGVKINGKWKVAVSEVKRVGSAKYG